MTELYLNKAVTYLDGYLNASSTSVPVISTSAFPTTGTFHVVVDTEIMTVSSVSGNTLTVSRGSEGTIAVAHNSGARTAILMTQAVLDGVAANRVLRGTFANRPTSGERIGQVYETSDSPIHYSWDGSVWKPYGPVFTMTQPNTSQFSWVCQGGSTYSTANGFLYLENPGGGASYMNLFATPVTRPFTATVAFYPLWKTETSDTRVGLGAYDSVTDHATGMFLYGPTEVVFLCNYDNAVSTGSSNTNNLTSSAIRSTTYGGLYWMRITSDATTGRSYLFSTDGFNWLTLLPSTTTSGSTQPNYVGPFVQGTIKVGMSIAYWNVS